MKKSECIFVFVQVYYNKDPKDGETIDYRASVQMYAIDVTSGLLAIANCAFDVCNCATDFHFHAVDV